MLSGKALSLAHFRLDPFSLGWELLAATFLPLLALNAFQWVGIAREGQTLGKKWLGIRIVGLDGAPPGFVRGVLVREWCADAAGAIPTVGPFVRLADVLFVFGASGRCVHDIVARTRVVSEPFASEPKRKRRSKKKPRAHATDRQ